MLTTINASFQILVALAVVSMLPLNPSAQSTEFETVLNCPLGCVGDGIGQQIIQEKCDRGDFDKFCQTGSCGCSLSTRQVQITCEEGTCFSASSLQPTRVEVFIRADVLFLYSFEAQVFNKQGLAPAICRARVNGSYKIPVDAASFDPKLVRFIEDAALKALRDIKKGVEVICEQSVKIVVESAIQKIIRPPRFA